MVEKKQTALQTVENFPVPRVADVDGFAEEMEGLNFEFTYVKVPSGGGTAFEIPTPDGDDTDVVKEIEGVIVHHHPVNAYWAEEYSGGNEPPDCSSMDGRVGTGEPGGYCRTCPMNEWGSGSDGTGKACQNRRWVFVLQQGEMFPVLFSLPPTSLSNFGNFISRAVLQKGMRSYQVVVKAKLKKAQSSGQIDYSQVTWSVVGMLDEKTSTEMKKYSEEVKALAAGLSYEDGEMDVVDTQAAPATSDDAAKMFNAEE